MGLQRPAATPNFQDREWRRRSEEGGASIAVFMFLDRTHRSGITRDY